MPKANAPEQERSIPPGFISIHRRIKENWIYEKGRKRTKFEAWLDLLMSATHTSNKEPIGFDLIQINRGQLLTSQDKLSKEWLWDRGSVRSFLQMLQKDKMISVETTTKYTVITICKYEDYQTLKPTRQQQVNNNPTSTQQQVPTLNNDINKGNNEEISLGETPLQKRKVAFGKLLEPFAAKYEKEMLKDFYNYWGEPNKSETKMRFELEPTWDLNLRLTRWASNPINFKANTPVQQNGLSKEAQALQDKILKNGNQH